MGFFIAALLYTSGLVYFIADDLDLPREPGKPWRFQWPLLLWPFTAFLTSVEPIWKALRR